MTSPDPQTTTDFWEAYLRAADAGTNSGPVSSVPKRASATIKFAWDLVILPAPIAAPAPPRAA
jgi:hypothetical protein